MSSSALFLTNAPPLPTIGGDRVRNYHLMRQLADRGWRLSLFSLVLGEPAPEEAQRTLEALCETTLLEPGHIDPRVRSLRVLRDTARTTAFQRDYFWLPRAAARLGRWLDTATFDVIVLSQLYMYRYLPPELRRIAVLDSQNAETLRVASMANGRGLTPRGLVARLQAKAVRRFEQQAVRSVALTLAVSEEERAFFDALAPGKARLIPNGVDLEQHPLRSALPSKPQLLFMGSLSYSANVDAVAHLLRDILPRLRRQDAELTILGSHPPRPVLAGARRAPLRTAVTGYVESTQPYVEASRLLVVPLRSGGGTRLKIVEALARGLPVISTSIGCAGLGLTHEQNIIVADDPADFARWIDRLLEDDELCHRMSCAGRAFVEEKCDWRHIGADLDSALREVVAGVPE